MSRTAVSALLLVLASCARLADRPLSTLPPDANPWWIDVSRDGRVVAYADRRGFQVFLVIGDRTYGPYT